VGSIYGPNNTDHPFFDNLNRDLLAFGNVPIILGGDWNATYSNLPVDVNPDCFNMASLPNRTHSDLINNMCVNLSISDPFRALNPVLRKFSYCPRAVGATNKSRIDFFLVSNSLLGFINKCDISDNLQSSAFDHKAMVLQFTGKSRSYGQQGIAGKTIADPDTTLLVQLSTL
jgi:exonuclease III